MSTCSRPILLNRVLREAGFLSVRPGPFGEMLDTFGSRAFAVCDHQVAHVYVNRADDQRTRTRARADLRPAGCVTGPDRTQSGTRSASTILAPASSWSCPKAIPGSPIPTGSTTASAPDFARTVDIHRKPGYDPCELFFDPGLFWPQGRAIRRLAQKKLGFRTLFDVVPLDPSSVRGSHGVPAPRPEDRPVLIGDGPAPPEARLDPDDRGPRPAGAGTRSRVSLRPRDIRNLREQEPACRHP